MARIRTIKPDLYEDEALGRCCVQARFLFVGLISHSDDEGRQRGAARLVGANVLPYDEDIGRVQIDKWLGELARERLIVLYIVGAQRYIAVRNWAKHQRVDHPRASALPAPDSPASKPIPEPLAKDPEPLAPEGKGKGKGSGREGKGVKEKTTSSLVEDRKSDPDEQTTQRPEVDALCVLLADLIEMNGVRRPDPAQKRWRDAARLMIDRDGLNPQHIEWIIRWAQSNDFWRANILSMPKLREKWPQLWLRAKAEHEKRNGATTSDQLRRWADEQG